MLRIGVFILLAFFISLSAHNQGNSIDDIYELEILKAGEIQPQGWIKTQMKNDLNDGYYGHYDEVNHTVTHNLFVKQNRRSKKRYNLLRSWWSGEHEGYWKDGVLRMAYLTGDSAYMELSSQWMNELLKHIDSTGYIGIYDDCKEKNCRFKHIGENGELWVTSRILMAVLAYYEFTGQEKFLHAAENASRLIIDKYKDENYFSTTKKRGGVSHGVGFFETLEWLYRITKDTSYLDFTKKLYSDFNETHPRDDDLQTHHLLDKDRYFEMHGAHISEGFFIPHFVSKISADPKYSEAAKNALHKLYYHITPGGAMRCDEWIAGRKGTADERYEYCGISEIISPLNKIITYTNDLSIADRIETMTFNAGQGSRFPVLKGVAYLSSDNRIKINHGEIGKRESYAAFHRAAACCALNAGRLMPYYVEGMWMKNPDDNEIIAALLGPNTLNTKINHVSVEIVENTQYPFSDKVEFIINPRKDKEFILTIRKPHQVTKYDLETPEGTKVKEMDDRIQLEKKWSKGDKITINFNFEINKMKEPESKTVRGGGFYLKRGPLVYALPFDYKTIEQKEMKESGFYRYKLTPRDKTGWKYRIKENENFILEKNNQQSAIPWNNPRLILKGNLYTKKGTEVPVELVPLGSTVFRRVTFPVAASE